MLKVSLHVNKKLALSLDSAQLEVIGRLASFGADALRKRAKRGVNHDGSQRPDLAVKARNRRFFFIRHDDPRVQALSAANLRPWAMRGQKGPPQWLVFRGHYREFKAALGRPTRKGSDFTGTMWSSLKASVRMAPGVGGDKLAKLYFAGSVLLHTLGPKGQSTSQRFRNRDKARLLQFAGRSGVGTHEEAGGREFELMRFSALELRTMGRMYARSIKLFKPR